MKKIFFFKKSFFSLGIALSYLFISGEISSTQAASSPSVSITSPGNGKVYINVPSSITIKASASESGGSISKVEFFANGSKLGEDLTSPYTFTWNNPAIGSYSLTAKATDKLLVSKTSTAINIRINAAPKITITSPNNGATFTAPANLSVAATASDSDGNITRVRFYRNGTLISADTSAPYSASWTNLPVGSYTLMASATDNNGKVTNSSSVAVTVAAPNVPPSVTLTSPGAGATFTEGDSINFAANASDSDGTITKVDFYQGSTLVGSDSSAPYTFTWSNPVAGSYTLSSKATDNNAAVSTSNGIGITVNPKPVDTGGTSNFCPPYTESNLYRPRARQVIVNPSQDWISILKNAQPNTEILLQDGVYSFGNNNWVPVGTDITVRSQSGNRDAVIIKGPGYSVAHDGFSIIGQNVNIADLSITQTRNHAISIKGETGTESPSIYNVHLYNTGTQMIKGTPDSNMADGVKNGVIACSRFEYKDDDGKTAEQWKQGDYNGGIDLHNAVDFLIRDNYFYGIDGDSGSYRGCEVDLCGAGYIAHPSIFVWNNSRGTITERNIIIDGFRGIAYGLGRNHEGGVIRNNVIIRKQFFHADNVQGDAGIELQTASNTLVAHNTVYTPGYRGAIEARESTGLRILNNFISSDFWDRGTNSNLTVTGNSGNFTPNELISPQDPHLKPSSQGIGACSLLPEVTTDIDGESRATRCDVGADFYSDGGGSTPPADTDGDGIADATDNCPTLSNTSQLDTDLDAQGDVCDTDDDNDGVLDNADAFPLNPNESLDTDSDGLGNNADTDDDGDGIADELDNCPLIYNVNQADADLDGMGDACDATPDPVSSSTIILQEGLSGYAGTNDTYISARAYPPENVANFGGSGVLRSFSTNDRRILIRFDLSQIPANASITSAPLGLFVQSNDWPSNPNIDCYRVTEDWIEGSKINEWDTPADGVTWTSRGPGKANWTQAGGSFAEKVCSSGVTVGQSTSCDLKSVVQQWVNGTAFNYGVMCTNTVAYANDMIFTSSEAGTLANRPKLTVTYAGSGSGGGSTPPPGPVCGNGILETGEECDDHNLVNNDGCSASCKIEVITPPPPPPSDTDGDGVSDSSDNCPLVSNASQTDTDHDGLGDSCDSTPNGSGAGQTSGNLRNTRLQNIQTTVSTYTNNSGLAQATGLTTLHRNGQTFITWTENTSLGGESYVVYQYTSPINSGNIANATPLAIVKENSGYYRSEATRSGSVQQRFIIQDNGAQLAASTGLFVNTTTDSGNFYYAVATVSNNQINKSTFSSANASVNAVNEVVNDPKPVLVATGSNNGRISRIYTQFMDYHNWNPTMHGYAYNYSVTVNSNYNPGDTTPMETVIHMEGKNTRYVNAEAYGDGIWVSFDDPFYSSYGEQDWYWGYSCYNDFQDASRNIVNEGPICNFSEIRMLRTLKDIYQDPYYANHADLKRIYAYGNSMGASAVLTWAMHYPQIFSVVYASQGMTDYASDPVWRAENESRWGAVAKNNPVLNLGITWVDGSNTAQNIEDMNGMGVWDYMDHKTIACDPNYASKETAFIMAVHGSNDSTIQAASQAYPFYQCMDSGKRGYEGLVNSSSHGWQGFAPGDMIDFRMLSIPWNISEDAIPATPGIDKDFPLQSYIAFSNMTGSDLLANAGLADYNLNVIWDVKNVIDQSNQYEAVLYASGGSVTGSVTPRRLQNFHPVANTSYVWQNLNSNNQVVASGRVTSDAHALITIPNFSITSSGNRLVITP